MGSDIRAITLTNVAFGWYVGIVAMCEDWSGVEGGGRVGQAADLFWLYSLFGQRNNVLPNLEGWEIRARYAHLSLAKPDGLSMVRYRRLNTGCTYSWRQPADGEGEGYFSMGCGEAGCGAVEVGYVLEQSGRGVPRIEKLSRVDIVGRLEGRRLPSGHVVQSITLK